MKNEEAEERRQEEIEMKKFGFTYFHLEYEFLLQQEVVHLRLYR